MNCNCIAGITTYNPNLERLYSNVEAIIGQVDKVIIVDNGSNNIDGIENTFSDFPDLLIIKNDENMGIAYAMNMIGMFARDNGYDWFLTLDQDSICPKDLINTYSKYTYKNVGIIAPHIQFNPSFISTLLHINKNENSDCEIIREVKYAISSGQFIQTKVWEEVDGFWEYLFIDYVDQELCFNISRRGYKILQITNVELSHEPGIPVKVFGISTAKQSAMREYYWARNSRLVYWLYKEEYMNAIENKPFWSTIKRVANVVLVHEDILDKLIAIMYGVIDAYIWKKQNKKDGRVPFNIDDSRRY